MSQVARQLCETLRQHLAGKHAPVPEGGRLAWQWFLDLNWTRARSMGPSPITYAESEAYSRLYRWPLEPRHVDLILDLDRTWLEWARAAGNPSGEGKAQPAPQGQEMTPALFDAVFS